MVFYEITAIVENLEELLGDHKELERNRRIRGSEYDFDAQAKKVFEESDRKCCVFLKSIKENKSTALFGAIAPNGAAAEEQLQTFMKYAQIQASGIRMTETTMRAVRDMLRMASRLDYIEDESAFLEPFELEDFLRCAPHHFDYTEKLLKPMSTATQLKNQARRLACEERMLPELGRIFQGTSYSKISGHPVHYQISSDDGEVSAKMSELLLTALLRAGRIRNHRFGTLHCDSNAYNYSECLRMAFRYCGGGALVIDLTKVASSLSDGDEAQDSAETIVTLCDCIQENRNSVLSVLILPRAAVKCKELLRENLGSIPLVELEEDMMYGERSKRFLRSIAKQHGITAPKALINQLDDDEKGWLPGDLKTLFDRWFSNYLREKVYPQYGSFAVSCQEIAQAKPIGSAFGELEAMIGLHSAKEVISQALDYYKAKKVFRDRGVKLDTPSLHMVFSGNPGTAKTTVARLFARIMKENGILSQGNLIEVGRGDLVGKYVGWTAQTVQKKFQAAKGSVLFIDEAYSLLDSQENSYGDEAINTIVQEMENSRNDTVVIFAGYPEQMERFLDRNPGLRSRIAFRVPFEDYSEDELYKIVEALAAAKGLRLDSGVHERLLPILREQMGMPDFGNGRFARSVVEKATMRQASRLIHGDVVHVSDRELQTWLPEDFTMNEVSVKSKRRTIGFAL